MRKVNNFKYVIIAFLLVVLACMVGGGNVASADINSGYSSVVDDLERDESFNPWDFPVISQDNSINVIQIAESTSGGLFIYTYQPCGKIQNLTATDINMYLSEEVNETQLYELSLVSYQGVFGKYRVKGLTVGSHKVIRYYNITSIARAWNSSVDDASRNDNTINKVSFPVGKVFTATTVKGSVVYYQQPTYVVKIIDPYTNYLTCISSANIPYPGLWSHKDWEILDSHYIAFSTDWDIDRLVSADVSYCYCAGEGYYESLFSFKISSGLKYGDEHKKTISLTADDRFEHDGNIAGLKWHTYSWNRINSCSDFISDVENTNSFSNETISTLKENLSGKEWVLSFLETERTQKETDVLIYDKYKTTFTKVSNVTVLRLEFESDGVAYNLGAVSDFVSTQYPDEFQYHWYDKIVNFFKSIGNFFKNSWWKLLLIVLGVVLAIVLVVCIVKFGFKAVLSGLWWFITLPFRFIAWIVKKISARRKRGKSKGKKK